MRDKKRNHIIGEILFKEIEAGVFEMRLPDNIKKILGVKRPGDVIYWKLLSDGTLVLSKWED